MLTLIPYRAHLFHPASCGFFCRTYQNGKAELGAIIGSRGGPCAQTTTRRRLNAALCRDIFCPRSCCSGFVMIYALSSNDIWERIVTEVLSLGFVIGALWVVEQIVHNM